MIDVRRSALRLYRRILGVTPPPTGQHPGVESTADGNSAVAAAELCVSEGAGLGSSFPAAVSAGRYFAGSRDNGTNLFASPIFPLQGGNPRGSLAAAMGEALGGLRSTVFLAGPDLLRAGELLGQAVGRRIPLVIHLVSRARPGSGDPAGSGHEALHAAGEAGCPVLVAANVQEAVDFALIARRTAERALTPVVVAMDGAETAASEQEVHLPSLDLVRGYLGPADAILRSPTPSQEMLFGHHRRPVPRWHDPERPLLTGSAQEPSDFALGEAARAAYFDPHVEDLLRESMDALETETGRRYAPVTTLGVSDAKVVLVVQGAAVETVEAVVTDLRNRRKEKVGVVGIRQLRPFPAARIIELLRGRKRVLVLERVAAPLGGDPPLMREIRSAWNQAMEPGGPGAVGESGAPRVEGKELPRLVSVFYGLGGRELRAADLESLVEQPDQGDRSPIFLGLDFSPSTGNYPKRQVLLDALHRHYPEAARLGLRADGPPPDLVGEGAVTVSVSRVAGQGGEQLAAETGRVLHRLLGGFLRARPAISWEHWDSRHRDRVTVSPQPLRDPGDDVRAELAVWFPAKIGPDPAAVDALKDGGALLVGHAAQGKSLWETLPARVRRQIKERNLRLYLFRGPEEERPELRAERAVGAILGVLRAEGYLELTPRKLLAARREMLEEMDPEAVDRRVATLQAGFDTVLAVDTTGVRAPSPVEEVRSEPEAPPSVRRLARTDEAVDSLPRFWDQVGVLYERGEESTLAPDPYLATGTLPPRSSSFRSVSDSRDTLPAFDPDLCTGCGACWSVCPDSALHSSVIGAAALIEKGMALVKESGESAEALRMMVSKLAGRLTEVTAQSEAGGGEVGPLLDLAFEKVMAKSSFPEKRRESIESAFARTRDAVASLPVARTPAFFDEPESAKKGSGEFFVLAVNPEACKGCRTCVAECEPGALTALPQDEHRLEKAWEIWKQVETLPKTSQETIERARQHEDVGPLAGALLSKEAQDAMVGGDGAEPGSGEKIAVRQVLAATEHYLQPRWQEHIEAVSELQEKVEGTIREHLADALPTQDLDALAEGLESVDKADTDLTELTGQVEGVFATGRVDVARLRRLVDAARRLRDLKERLESGIGGLGRAHFGLVVAPGSPAAWAGTFPYNPFAVPVALDAGPETMDLARGIVLGQIQETLEDFRLLRRARLELQRPTEAALSAEKLRALTWRDLNEEERRLCPPLFLVAAEASLSEGSLGSLAGLLGGSYPVKLLILSDLDLGLPLVSGGEGAGGTWGGTSGDLAAMSLTNPRALVVQTSIAHPAHLDASLREALAFDGPAVIRIYAPSPTRHGFPMDASVRRAREAVTSRAFPLFRSVPAADATSLPVVDLTGNPQAETDWVAAEEDRPITPADWALGEERFAEEFTPAAEEKGEAVPLVEYVGLSCEDREGKLPVVTRPDSGEPWCVSERLVRAVEARLAGWRWLRQQAARGRLNVTEATPAEPDEDKVTAATEALQQQHAQELAALQQAYEARLSAVQAELTVNMARRVKGKLMALVGRTPADGGGKE